MNAGERFHYLSRLGLRIRTARGANPIKLRHVYPPFSEFILGNERMLPF